jgi:exodeoxyribonuclease V alpha subunit
MPHVEGLIRNYLFYNEENGYSVIKLEIIDTNEPKLLYYQPTVVVSGFFPRLETGARYRFDGEYVDHPKYGTQYKASRFERILENTKDGIVEYLASDLFKGIGPKTAMQIVDTLGLDCLDQIAANPDVLDKVKKLTAPKKKTIYETLRSNRLLESTLIWLYGFEISPKMSFKIIDRYGYKTVDVVKSNPYVLIDEVEGIGFKRADDIGLKIGFPTDSPLRVRAVLYYLLNEYLNKYGDTLLSKTKLVEFTLTFLNRGETSPVEAELVESILKEEIDKGRLIEQGDVVLLKRIYEAERDLAIRLREIAGRDVVALDEALIEEQIGFSEARMAYTLTEEQKKAVREAFRSRLVVITGGPGTGKTTIVKTIVDVYRALLSKRSQPFAVRLAAPTGKAAKRLSDATGEDASTIHRLLGYDYSGIFACDENHPLDGSFFIVDEASMMDVLLARQFFLSVPTDATVIVVGDENQLPSVGPGQVLSDLIASGVCPVVRLTKIHRQAKGSAILNLAYSILNQEMPESIPRMSDDLVFHRRRDPEISGEVLKTILACAEEGYDLFEDVQVLVPMYKGAAGIDAINALVQQSVNQVNAKNKMEYGSQSFWLNDKVIQLVNQPEDGVMNGDIGKVVAIVENVELQVDFSGTIVKYNKKDLDNLALAYAISVHKAQGSEFKIAVLPLSLSHRMMLRKKLLYTAITRAKQRLVLIGDWFALKNGILGIEPPRNTLLKSWLKEEIDVAVEREPSLDDFM